MDGVTESLDVGWHPWMLMAQLNPWMLDGVTEPLDVRRCCRGSCRDMDAVTWTALWTHVYRDMDGPLDPRVGPPQFSPNAGQGYHYFHNGETYYLTGLAMARGMVQMMPH
jgi:hypothetical protein